MGPGITSTLIYPFPVWHLISSPTTDANCIRRLHFDWRVNLSDNGKAPAVMSMEMNVDAASPSILGFFYRMRYHLTIIARQHKYRINRSHRLRCKLASRGYGAETIETFNVREPSIMSTYLIGKSQARL